MLALRVLGAVPDIPTTHPLSYGGSWRQSWDAHITVGAQDATPGRWYGYDWKCTVTAYRPWTPGRHGTSCPDCAHQDGTLRPAGPRCGHLQDGEPLTDTWGKVFSSSFPVRTTADHAARRLYDPDRLAQAVHAADAALTALPPSCLEWTAYGPAHDYGHWAGERQARDWLIGHMNRLSNDPNLGPDRRQTAADCAARLAQGAQEVAIGAKRYGIRHDQPARPVPELVSH